MEGSVKGKVVVEAASSARSHSEPDAGPSQSEDGHLAPINSLLSTGITEADIEKLKKAGFFTIDGVAIALKKKLVEKTGLSENKVEKIQAEAHKRVHLGFTTATDILQKREDAIKIMTGVKSLNDLLHGGFESGGIIELYGPGRCGKTQLCHVLAVTSQLSVDEGGAEAKSIYIASEDCFRPSRIVAIARKFHLDPSQVLDNISFARARSTDHQYDLLVHARALLSRDRYGILIVDSVTHLYRAEYSAGRSELSARQQHLGKFLRGLKDIADEYGVCVVIVNQVMSDVSGSGIFDPVIAAGGHVLAHFAKTRLQLKKGRGPNRICKVVNSAHLPVSEAVFAINESGIGDAIID